MMDLFKFEQLEAVIQVLALLYLKFFDSKAKYLVTISVAKLKGFKGDAYQLI